MQKKFGQISIGIDEVYSKMKEQHAEKNVDGKAVVMSRWTVQSDSNVEEV